MNQAAKLLPRIEAILGDLQALHDRLRTMGYRFTEPNAALPGPGVNVQESLRRIEVAVGPVPLALQLFYERIGSVDFTGHHPDWHGCEYPDPIFVYPVEDAVEELDEYLADPSEYAEAYGGFRLPVAPDYYHKEDVSGGPCYGVQIPNTEADPALLEEWHHTTFLDYLEIAIRSGGFPGLERCAGHDWPVADLIRGLPSGTK